MGDNEKIVKVAVKNVDTDEAAVGASFEGKEKNAKESKKHGKAVTAGDGTNDVFVSISVDPGTVTGVGMDAVTDVVDAASAKSCSVDAFVITRSGRVISCNTYENSPRVPTHNATGTLSVTGVPTNSPGR